MKIYEYRAHIPTDKAGHVAACNIQDAADEVRRVLAFRFGISETEVEVTYLALVIPGGSV